MPDVKLIVRDNQKEGGGMSENNNANAGVDTKADTKVDTQNTASAAANAADGLGDIAAIKAHNIDAKAAESAVEAAISADLQILEEKEKETGRRVRKITIISTIIFAVIGAALYITPLATQSSSIGRRETKAAEGGASQSEKSGERGDNPAERSADHDESGGADDGEGGGSGGEAQGQQSLQSDIARALERRRAAQIQMTEDDVQVVDNADDNATVPQHRDPADFHRERVRNSPNDIAAWRGLLEHYRADNQTNEADETERRMKARFGEHIIEVTDLIARFGSVMTAAWDGGRYRVDYRTNQRGRDEILTEVFSVTRALRAIVGTHNISLFASTGSGRGMEARSTGATRVDARARFERSAEILWLE